MYNKRAPNGALLLSDFFFNLCGLTNAITQIVKLRTAYTAASDEFNFLNMGRMNRKNPFNSHAVSNAANSKSLIDTSVFFRFSLFRPL